MSLLKWFWPNNNIWPVPVNYDGKHEMLSKGVNHVDVRDKARIGWPCAVWVCSMGGCSMSLHILHGRTWRERRFFSSKKCILMPV